MELQSLLGTLNYLSKFSPMTAEVCEPLQKLTTMKAEWSLYKMIQDLYNKTKKIIQKDACIKFYNASRLLYLEPDASGVDLRAGILQVRGGMNCGCDKVLYNVALHSTAFASKNLLGTEWHYKNIEWETLGILHGLEKFHHYFFAQEVCMVMDHKPFVVKILKMP